MDAARCVKSPADARFPDRPVQAGLRDVMECRTDFALRRIRFGKGTELATRDGANFRPGNVGGLRFCFRRHGCRQGCLEGILERKLFSLYSLSRWKIQLQLIDSCCRGQSHSVSELLKIGSPCEVSPLFARRRLRLPRLPRRFGDLCVLFLKLKHKDSRKRKEKEDARGSVRLAPCEDGTLPI